MSLIAACAAERVYQYFIKGSKLMPNLYTFLLADSGIGKGNTCNLVSSFLKKPELRVAAGWEESRTTAQGIMDRLAGRTEQFMNPSAFSETRISYNKDDPASSRAGSFVFVDDDADDTERLAAQHRSFLVFEELAMSVGSGPRADEFIKFLTKTFGGQGFKDRTRTYGEIDIGDEISLNVLAGSTHSWLKDCVKLDAVLGGFFARCIVVDAELENGATTRRIWRPTFAWDVDIVRAHLEARVRELVDVRGEFKLTDEADAIGKKWYDDRPDPDDPNLGPIFRREKATVLKLALLFALAEGRFDDMKIHSRHMAKAQMVLRRLGSAVLKVVAYASISRETRGLIEIREFIRSNQPVLRTAVAKFASSLGVGPDQFRRVISMLKDDMAELVVSAGEKKGAVYYSINERSGRLSDTDDTAFDLDEFGDEVPVAAAVNATIATGGATSRFAVEDGEVELDSECELDNEGLDE